jgi:hypothetical protein
MSEEMKTLESAKKLTETELKKYQFNDRSIIVNVDDIKVGDYIICYSKKGFIKGRHTTGKVNRITSKTFFINPIVCNDANICHTFKLICVKEYQYVYNIYNYYYINITDNHNVSTNEIKVLKRIASENGTLLKADKNYIDMTVGIN